MALVVGRENQSSKAVGFKTKTMSWKILRRVVELRESGDAPVASKKSPFTVILTRCSDKNIDLCSFEWRIENLEAHQVTSGADVTWLCVYLTYEPAVYTDDRALLPSLRIPTRKHFFRRQYWHWLRWCWSIWHSRLDLQNGKKQQRKRKRKTSAKAHLISSNTEMIPIRAYCNSQSCTYFRWESSPPASLTLVMGELCVSWKAIKAVTFVNHQPYTPLCCHLQQDEVCQHFQREPFSVPDATSRPRGHLPFRAYYEREESVACSWERRVWERRTGLWHCVPVAKSNGNVDLLRQSILTWLTFRAFFFLFFFLPGAVCKTYPRLEQTIYM